MKLRRRICFIFILNFVNFHIMLILRLFWAYFRQFWGPMTVQNPPMDLTFSEYALVWVQEQNRAFVQDFWAICCFSCGWSLFANLVTYSHPIPPHPPKCMNKLRFVVKAYGTLSFKVTSRKSNLQEEFGSFLFLILSISLKCSFWGFFGPILGYFEVLWPFKILLWN